MRLIDADELIKSLKPFKIGEQQIYGCGSWHFVDKCINEINIMTTIEPVKAYTKADYIMALHKEYGCTLTMAEEAHNKALEYLQSKARMKG